MKKTKNRLAKGIVWFGHPMILALALLVWWTTGRSDGSILLVQTITLLMVLGLEKLIPANPGWRLRLTMFAKLIGVYLLGMFVTGLLLVFYDAVLVPNLKAWALPPALSLVNLPFALQIVLLFLFSDLVYYWGHRAIHNSAIFWRVSGHGFHHGFHDLHGVNAGSNHPFELVFILLPLIVIASLTGASGEAVSGTSALLVANVLLTHANVNMQTPIFNAIVTCSNQHRRHHSLVFSESNTNYACNAILWDHLFGTYSSGPVQQTGIGPRQPPIWKMYLLPFSEPDDADTVSTRRKLQSETDKKS